MSRIRVSRVRVNRVRANRARMNRRSGADEHLGGPRQALPGDRERRAGVEGRDVPPRAAQHGCGWG
jgi:hypothetical protein